MLNYIKGDLLNTPDKILFHGCNSLGVMGAGVALAIRKKWPDCFKVYKRAYTDYGLALGEVVWYKSPSKVIANCITQLNTGTDRVQVDYNSIRVCVQKVLRYASKNNETYVSCPKIGAGLAGGDWSIISQILEEESNYFEVDINIYTLD